MAETIYKVLDPSGAEREISGPEGATDEEVIAQAKKLFGSTAGGAAVGNPNMQAQSRNLRQVPVSTGERLATIGGAGVAGTVLGAMSPEILTAAGSAATSFPATAPLGAALMSSANVLRGGRLAAATMGGVGGLAGETAGQAVEASGGPQLAAEGARVAGGALSGETLNLAKTAVQKLVVTPSLSLFSRMRKEMAKTVLEKLNGMPESLTDAELKFVNEQIGALRGGAKTDAPLERVGSIMGNEGKRLLDEGEQKMIAAMQNQSQIGPMSAFQAKPNADVGERLRDVINTRNQAALEARAQNFQATERIRDLNIASHEKAGRFIDRTPEYSQLVNDLEARIAGNQDSPSVKSGLQKVLDDIYNPNTTGRTSFNAIDQVRRKLGDAFRGKPAEGYDAIDSNVAKDLYGRLSNLQKKYAGPAQEKLLEDYAASTEGLQIFSSKMGKKATALDQYREGQYATDASTLPSNYFKTRASVNALKELTGNNATVNTAALEYADKQLTGKTAPQAREWMAKNAEWLAEVGPANRLIAKYVDKLEGAERSLANATDFAKKAVARSEALTRDTFPANRAVDLIKSGDTELWGMVTPLLTTPESKAQVVAATRQVLADQATSANTINLFERSIRPALEGGKIASKAEMDFIAKRLSDIQEMKIPEPEKLGIAKRLLLQSTGTWAASAASRGGVEGFKFMSNMVPTDQSQLRPAP